MFIAIITLLFLGSLTAEWFIYRRVLAMRSSEVRKIYYTATALAIIPYLIIYLIGRIWELHSTLFSTLGAIFISLFLFNALWKIPQLFALLPRSAKLRHNLSICGLIFSALLSILILHSSLIERYRLNVTRVELGFDNLPEGADGLTIAQFGDLHIGKRVGRHRILRLLSEEIGRHRPMLIVDCGDMVNSRYDELDSLAIEILSSIKAPLGVYTVFGNHDRGDYILDTLSLPREEHRQLLLERQHSMGWRNITGQTATLAIGGDSLYLTAIPYPEDVEKGRHGTLPEEDYTPYFDTLPKDAFNIILAHTPAMWNNILNATEAELTLSGHVHSMQMRIPLGSRGWSPAAWVYDQWSGLYHSGPSALFVTDGIGGSVPLRLGSRPQLVLITLRQTPTSSNQ